MSFFKKHGLTSIFALATLLLAESVQGGISVIVSTPPPAREIIVGPPGYTSCYFVQPGFYNGVWHHKHRVCEYEGNTGLRMWVNGYWQCGSYRVGGICTGWHWIGSHWANRGDMEFYRHPVQREVHRHAQMQIHGHQSGFRHGHEHENRHYHH